MKVVLQRVNSASVSVDNKKINEIKKGLLILVGFTYDDSEKDINYLVNKIINLRIFDDDDGVMNKSLLDINGNILSISQFTLYADTNKGRRPSYTNALDSKEAIILYKKFNDLLRHNNINIKEGIFGANMMISLTNLGPVTIVMESRDGLAKN